MRQKACARSRVTECGHDVRSNATLNPLAEPKTLARPEADRPKVIAWPCTMGTRELLTLADIGSHCASLNFSEDDVPRGFKE